jgi:hypothetical protein
MDCLICRDSGIVDSGGNPPLAAPTYIEMLDHYDPCKFCKVGELAVKEFAMFEAAETNEPLDEIGRAILRRLTRKTTA